MTDEATERGELRELLLDGVAPPPDADRDAMFENTFAASGTGGADLLPPDDLFDDPDGPTDPADDLPIDDGIADDRHDGADDVPVSSADLPDPAETTPDIDVPDLTHDPGDPTSGW